MRFCDSLSSRWLPHLTVACVLGTLMIYGCGPKPVRPPQSEQASVTGSVMFEGKPVTLDSTVVFYCKDKDATAAGKLDSLGKFSLKGAQSSVGIPVGRYVVMVSPPEPPMTTSAAADVNSPEFIREAHRQSLAVANSPHAADDQAFVDAITQWPPDGSDE